MIRLPIPLRSAARRGLYVPAKRALVSLFLVLERIEVVAQECFRQGGVNLAFVLRYQLFPADVARVGRTALIVHVESGFFCGELGVTWKIRADKVAVFGPPH